MLNKLSTLNWKRGSFRIWVILSLVWIITVGIDQRTDIEIQELISSLRENYPEEYFRAEVLKAAYIYKQNSNPNQNLNTNNFCNIHSGPSFIDLASLTDKATTQTEDRILTKSCFNTTCELDISITCGVFTFGIIYSKYDFSVPDFDLSPLGMTGDHKSVTGSDLTNPEWYISNIDYIYDLYQKERNFNIDSSLKNISLTFIGGPLIFASFVLVLIGIFRLFIWVINGFK